MPYISQPMFFWTKSWSAIVRVLLTFLFFANPLRAELVTTLQSFAELVSTATDSPQIFQFDLSADILYANPLANELILQQHGTTLMLRLDLKDLNAHAGGRLLLRGEGTLQKRDSVYLLTPTPLIDNDGLHVSRVEVGELWLDAGPHPVALQWFNGGRDAQLSLRVESPNMPIQEVPARLWTHLNAAHELVPGLAYSVYEARVWQLPVAFTDRLLTVRGTCPEVQIPKLPTLTELGVTYMGFFNAPEAGHYRFELSSDDGAKLFIGPSGLHASVEPGTATHVNGISINAGQILEPAITYQQVYMSGTVSAVSADHEGWRLELRSSFGKASVIIAEEGLPPSAALLQSRVRVFGICMSEFSSEGVPVAAKLYCNSRNDILVDAVNPLVWDEYPLLSLAEAEDSLGSNARQTLRLRGNLLRVGEGWTVNAGTIAMPVQFLGGTEPDGEGLQELLVELPAKDGKLRNAVIRRTEQHDATSTPSIRSITKIHRLSREELEGHPQVAIEGVVTCPLPVPNAFLLHDGEKAVYVDLDPILFSAKTGDLVRVEGYAANGDFSPFVKAESVRSLGTRQMPEPVRPGLRELIDGSLHCQFVEIEGVVTDVVDRQATLFIPSGKVSLTIEDQSPELLESFHNCLVRIRGSLFVRWDYDSRRITVGRLTFNGTQITLLHGTVADPFSIPGRPVRQLLQFDPTSRPFQPVKVSGQLLRTDAGVLYVQDCQQGVRVQPVRSSVALPAGRMLEAVGFLDLSGPSPKLLEAQIRQTSDAPLPDPIPLSMDGLLDSAYDAVRVEVEALLLAVHYEENEAVLELQAGDTRFMGRLPEAVERDALPAKGSTLLVRGTYRAKGGNRLLNLPIDGFDLLLNGPTDIRVLVRPPWWTLQRLLVMLGVLLAVLAIALLWIHQLRKLVLLRGQQLEQEILVRQQAEQQRALQEERTRLAQDLHDDLGAGLTEVMMLGAVAIRNNGTGEQKSRIGDIVDTARRLVTSLDEIVWAINPRYDSFSSALSYIVSHTQRFLELADIRCRFDIPDELPELRLNSGGRHALFLAVKEVLNNVVQHSGASEVTLRIRATEGQLRLTLSDNGCGIRGPACEVGMDGLSGIGKRLDSLGGSCELGRPESGPGTVVTLHLPIQ